MIIFRNRLYFAVVLVLLLAAPLKIRFAWAEEQQGFTFVVANDLVRSLEPPYSEDPRYFVGVCKKISQVGSGAFMVGPGDLYPPWTAREIISRYLGDDYPWYPAPGNHDAENAQDMQWMREYNRNGLQLPDIVRAGPDGARETVYAFEYGPAHFAVLNVYFDGKSDSGTDGDVCDALYDWLETDLAANTRPFIFVIGHEPILSAPDIDNGRIRHLEDSLNQYPDNDLRFTRLLRKYHAVYICGHTHNASFINLNGVWQISTGHSKGLNDLGALSSFIRVNVGGGPPEVELWRDDGSGTNYTLHSKRLLYDLAR